MLGVVSWPRSLQLSLFLFQILEIYCHKNSRMSFLLFAIIFYKVPNILHFHQNCSSAVFIFRLVLNLEDIFFVGINICFMLSFLLKLQGNLYAFWCPKLLKKIHFVFIAQKYFARRNFFCVKRFFAQKKNNLLEFCFVFLFYCLKQIILL